MSRSIRMEALAIFSAQGCGNPSHTEQSLLPLIMSTQKRQCILLCPEYFDGQRNGIGRVSSAMAEAFERAGLQPVIWSANEPHGIATLPNRSFGRRYFRMILAALFNRMPDVSAIACLHSGLSPVARILADRLHVPWLCWLHGVEVWKPLRARTRWGMKGRPLLCSNSSFTKSRAADINPGLGLDLARVVPLGWTLPSPPESPADPGCRHGVLAVGRLSSTDRYKGFDTLIEAWKPVGDAVSGCRLTIVGDGDDRPRLEALVRKNSLQHSVEFLGEVETSELQRQFSSRSVFAMPSSGEGFGLVFAEAMAYGLPCVCGNRDASSEVVADGLTGFCVDPDSPQAVAGALIRLLENPVMLKEFSQRARKAFLEKFDLLPLQNRMDSLVRALLVNR